MFDPPTCYERIQRRAANASKTMFDQLTRCYVPFPRGPQNVPIILQCAPKCSPRDFERPVALPPALSYSSCSSFASSSSSSACSSSYFLLPPLSYP
eukprot:9472818-Pyramimonas_sp.AAC.1